MKKPITAILAGSSASPSPHCLPLPPPQLALLAMGPELLIQAEGMLISKEKPQKSLVEVEET